MTAAPPSRPTRQAAPRRQGAPGRHAFREDVEGLRAVAIGLVLAYHAGLPVVPGGFVGVDVFFVISGFLITGLLVAEIRRTGTVSLPSFWARRARRLLPATALVLGVTAVVGWAVLPRIDHGLVGGDIVAAALYVANLRFAVQDTDYLAADRAPSPVLHFWSLGVEEQFYVVWPLLLVALVVLWTRHRARREPAGSGWLDPVGRGVTGLLSVVAVASFVFSLWLTRTAEPWAFFGMPTRAWEFALGGLVGLAAPLLTRQSHGVRLALGVTGFALVLGSGVLLNAELPYPGTAAIWPVLGTAAIIAASAGGVSVGPARVLLTWPMRAVGRLSYSWYLWHWPVLVLAAAAMGPLGTPAKVALVLLSAIPAALAYRFVERPVHLSRSLAGRVRASLLIGAACSLAGVAAGLGLAAAPGGASLAAAPAAGTSTEAEAPAFRGDDTAGTAAAATAPGAGTSPAPSPARGVGPRITAVSGGGAVVPSPADARNDLPVTYEDGCHLEIGQTSGGTCAYGATSSRTEVVLLGDSHAAQWFPAMEAAAKAKGWRLLSRTKSGCPAPDVTIYQRKLKRAYAECDQWRAATLDTLTGTRRPAVVVAAGTPTDSLVDRSTGDRADSATARRLWADGWRATLTRLTAAGIPVVVVRDTPWAGFDVPGCVEQRSSDVAQCGFSARATLPPTSLDVGVAASVPGATGLDLTDTVCDGDRCAAVRGVDGKRLLAYRDDNHLTATFARALSPRLTAAVAAAIR